MKSTSRIMHFLFLFGAMALIGSSVFAQERSATLSPDGIILLPAEAPLKEAYSFDISSLGLASEVDAVNYFKNQGAKTHFFRAIPGQSRAVLYLDLKSNPKWDVADWNAYLESHKLKPINVRESDQR